MNKYFSKARAMAHKNFSNYSGSWSNLVPNKFMNAEGGAINAGVGKSQPYNFTIANGGTTEISDVVLLGGYENTAGNASNYGNDADITITMNNGAITYPVFLESIKSTPFTVGLIYLQSSNSSQVIKQLTVTYQESNGKKTELPISPALDPMQNLDTVLNQYIEFPVDGYTKITFDLLASTTVNIRLYPMAVLDTANTLVGQSAQTPYLAPKMSQFNP